MKIALYSPYLHILGGGERFILTIAKLLAKDHEVYLLGDEGIRNQSQKIFNIPLNQVKFANPENIANKNIIDKLFFTKQFDIFLYMTDGSLFLSSARKNFIIIQSPSHIPTVGLSGKIKMLNWRIICYSLFVKDIIKKRLNHESYILPPAIEQSTENNSKKENLILSVGRFFLYPHNKKQDILIEIFKKYSKSKFKNYQLVFAGGLTEKSGEEYLDRLKKKAIGLPIKFYLNPTYKELMNLYARSLFYWHAAGFGEDLDKFPERAEHFGITTLEAMSRGAIPIVYNAGGQKEIVSHGNNGFLWNTEYDLVEYTARLIKNKTLRNKLAKKARERSLDFTEERFYANLKKILEE